MLADLIAMLCEPEHYVCSWRNGELYVRRIEPQHEPRASRNEPAQLSRRTQKPEYRPHSAASLPSARHTAFGN